MILADNHNFSYPCIDSSKGNRSQPIPSFDTDANRDGTLALPPRKPHNQDYMRVYVAALLKEHRALQTKYVSAIASAEQYRAIALQKVSNER